MLHKRGLGGAWRAGRLGAAGDPHHRCASAHQTRIEARHRLPANTSRSASARPCGQPAGAERGAANDHGLRLDRSRDRRLNQAATDTSMSAPCRVDRRARWPHRAIKRFARRVIISPWSRRQRDLVASFAPRRVHQPWAGGQRVDARRHHGNTPLARGDRGRWSDARPG